MYILQEYYLERGKIKSHPCFIGKVYNECYKLMISIDEGFPGKCILYPCIPSKCRDDFIKSIFEKDELKNKSVLTIINTSIQI